MVTSDITHSVGAIESAQFERLVLGFENHIDHSAHLGGHNVVGAVPPGTAFPFPHLEGLQRPIDARLHHITGHQFESLFQVFSEHFIRPIEVVNKSLESIQFPKEVFG